MSRKNKRTNWDNDHHQGQLLFKRGEKIEAQFGGHGGEWYPGTIGSRKRKDGTYRVNYDDGDVDLRLLPRFIRRPKAPPGTNSTNESSATICDTLPPRKKHAGDKGKEAANSKSKLANNSTTQGDVHDSQDYSAYELQRLRKISANKALLETLGLTSTAPVVPQITAHRRTSAVGRRMKALGVSKPKREKVKREPTRRSLRVQGKQADGTALPPTFKEPKWKQSRFRRSNDRAIHEELSISGNVEVDEDGKQFFQSLQKRHDTATHNAGSAPIDSHLLKYAERLAQLEVDEAIGVRKVVFVHRYL